MRSNGAAPARKGDEHPLVDHVKAALRELASAPQARGAAEAAIHDVDRTWLGKRFTIGLAGDNRVLCARLINHVCGHDLIDPVGRPQDDPAVRVRHGRVARVRATRDDGSTEEATIAVDADRAESLSAHTDELRAFIAAKRDEAEALERSLPAIVRVRPPVWALWLWPVRWIRRWRARHTLAARDRALAVAAEPERELTRVNVQHARVAGAPEQLAGAVHRLSRTPGVRAIDVSVVDGRLPPELELVEVVGKPGVPLDAGIYVDRDGVCTITGSGVTLPLGDVDAALEALPALAWHGRALRIGRRYRTKITSALNGLADALHNKEASFGERLERLAQLRLVDPKSFVETQLREVLPHIVVSIQSVMEHAAAHLGVELAELASRWLAAVAAAPSRAELARTAAEIEASWTVETQRIANDLRLLVGGGVRGAACDLYPFVVEPLRAHGLPSEYGTLRAAPEVAPLALLPRLHDASAPTLAAGRFANLLRSTAGVRQGLHDRLRAQLETLTVGANAQLLSSEPLLYQTLSEMIANELEVAIGHQVEWLARAESDEQSAIAAERAGLAHLVVVRDAVHLELTRITHEIERLELDPLGR